MAESVEDLLTDRSPKVKQLQSKVTVEEFDEVEKAIAMLGTNITKSAFVRAATVTAARQIINREVP